MFKKIKSRAKLLFITATAAVLSMALGLTAFAAEGDAVVTADQFSPVLDALKTQINVTTIISVLVVVVGAGVGLAFMWWGVRKVTGALMKAFKKGKVEV